MNKIDTDNAKTVHHM